MSKASSGLLHLAEVVVAFAVIAISVVSPRAVRAGELINGATIASIAAASNDQDQFTITIVGGTGPCAGQSITFPVALSPSEMAWSTVFGLAAGAMKNAQLIRAYNYVDNDCSKAVFLQVFK